MIDIVVPPMLLPRRRDEPIPWPAGIHPHPDLLEFLSYWQSLVKLDGSLPSRADISPFELRRILAGIALLDVLPPESQRNPYRYRFRLLGTGHQQHLGVDLTGKDLTEILPPERLRVAHEAFVPIIRELRPGYLRMNGVGITVTSAYYERIVAPLSADGATVNMLIGVWVWLPFDKVHRGATQAGSMASP